jgi:plasmid stabilization system protein ParE
MRVVFTPEATAQLVSLYNYTAQRSGPVRALSYTDAVVAYCESFAVIPRRGTRRDELRPGLGTTGFRKRVTIAFDVVADVTTIIGIFYGGQDFESVLTDDEPQ